MPKLFLSQLIKSLLICGFHAGLIIMQALRLYVSCNMITLRCLSTDYSWANMGKMSTSMSKSVAS